MSSGGIAPPLIMNECSSVLPATRMLPGTRKHLIHTAPGSPSNATRNRVNKRGGGRLVSTFTYPGTFLQAGNRSSILTSWNAPTKT